MSKEEFAVQTFKDGFACSQAVLLSYANEFNIEKETASKIADSFGGGMGRMGLTCGAVTGALMVIGLKHGRVEATDTESKQKTIDAVREFSKLYAEKNGSITCKELLGYDISNPEELSSAVEQGLFSSICPKLVGDAINILDCVLSENGKH